jgi:hypothetical protein
MAKNGFVDWRFFHEKVADGSGDSTTFSLFEALPAIRGYLLTSYPKWEEVDSNEILGHG